MSINIGAVQASGSDSDKHRNIGAVQTIPDPTDTPVLSSPTVSAVSTTEIAADVSSDTAEGTVWRYVSLTNTEPSVTDLKNGTGSVAADSHNVTATGAQGLPNVTGLSDGTLYYVFFYQEDASGNGSSIVSDSDNTLLTINFPNTVGFSPGTTYYAHMLHKNPSGDNSSIVSASATTDPAAVVKTPPPANFFQMTVGM